MYAGPSPKDPCCHTRQLYVGSLVKTHCCPIGNCIMNIHWRILAVLRCNYTQDHHSGPSMKDLCGSTKQLYIGHHSRPTRRLYAGPLVSLPSYEIIIDWSFTKGSLSSYEENDCWTFSEGSLPPYQKIYYWNSRQGKLNSSTSNAQGTHTNEKFIQ